MPLTCVVILEAIIVSKTVREDNKTDILRLLLRQDLLPLCDIVSFHCCPDRIWGPGRAIAQAVSRRLPVPGSGHVGFVVD
jgi:hypothetical protein